MQVSVKGLGQAHRKPLGLNTSLWRGAVVVHLKLVVVPVVCLPVFCLYLPELLLP